MTLVTLVTLVTFVTLVTLTLLIVVLADNRVQIHQIVLTTCNTRGSSRSKVGEVLGTVGNLHLSETDAGRNLPGIAKGIAVTPKHSNCNPNTLKINILSTSCSL